MCLVVLCWPGRRCVVLSCIVLCCAALYCPSAVLYELCCGVQWCVFLCFWDVYSLCPLSLHWRLFMLSRFVSSDLRLCGDCQASVVDAFLNQAGLGSFSYLHASFFPSLALSLSPSLSLSRPLPLTLSPSLLLSLSISFPFVPSISRQLSPRRVPCCV